MHAVDPRGRVADARDAFREAGPGQQRPVRIHDRDRANAASSSRQALGALQAWRTGRTGRSRQATRPMVALRSARTLGLI